MKKKLVSHHIFICLILVFATAGVAYAQTTEFSYQGHLSASGNPATGNYEMRFELFDAPAGGAQVGATLTNASVAVSNGVFANALDFGAPAFDGSARYLEIAVRPANDLNPFTVLSPRQPILSVPYAIRSLNATQLNGVDASEYVTTANGPANFIQNTTTPQVGANFNIDGNGTAESLSARGALSLGGSAPPSPAPAGEGRIYFDTASSKMKVSEDNGAFVDLVGAGGVSGSGTTNSIPLWSAGTTLANSLISQSGTTVQLPGFVSLAATPSGNNVSFGTPNTETGMTISGPVGRADVRFDGTTLRLLAGPAGGPPSNGIGVTSTNVQLPNAVSLAATASGNNVSFGSPNSETGMTISGPSGRADVRFSGTTLKLLAGAGGIPSNGITVFGSTGDVAIGTTAGNLELGLYSGNVAKLMVEAGTSYGVAVNNSSPVNNTIRAINSSSGTAVSGFSDGGIGVLGSSSIVGLGNGGTGVYASGVNPGSTALYVQGSARQSRDSGGLLKAMALIRVVHTGANNTSSASVLRCYNSINNSSSGNCGIGFGTVYGLAGVEVNFGFQVTDRFISITGNSQYGGGTVTGYPNSTTVQVLEGNAGTDEFFIFVY